jgi:tripartite-type tricarboxylate transporter receptor subunit TctC
MPGEWPAHGERGASVHATTAVARSRRRGWGRRVIAPLAIATLVLAACGDDVEEPEDVDVDDTEEPEDADEPDEPEDAEDEPEDGSDDEPEEDAEDAEAAAETDYPTDDIELIVPYAAGGGTDLVARAVAEGLEDVLEVSVDVVNVEGGAGVVGKERLVNAEPDGHTIGSATVHMLTYHRTGLGEVTKDDIEPIGQVSDVPAGVTVADDAPWEDVNELLDHARENPGELVGSGTGIGGIWDIARAGLLDAAGLEPDAIRWVPSEGAAPALQELTAGGIDVSFASLPENATMLEEGRVRALASTGEERQPGFDDVPTLIEEGIDFSVGAFRGYAAPPGTPPEVIAVLDDALGQVVESEDFIEVMENSNNPIVYRNAEEYAEFMDEQDAVMEDLIADMELD